MAEKELSARISLRHDTKANWTSVNPVLLLGEAGVESDTNKFKFGDGVTAWSSLPYADFELAVATASVLGGVKSQTAATNKVVVASDGTMSVSEVTKATKLSNARTISISGDATGSATFDGSADKSIAITLANSGATAGTYPKVTVNAKGLVTGGASLTAGDIPTLTLAKISDAGTAAAKNVGAKAGNVPILGTDGKLDTAILPALAITDTYVVASQAAMLALTAQVGDIAVRTDVSKSYILRVDGASTLANWTELATPADKVSSVNGKTGAVTLTTSDVAEGSNLYFTTARGNSNFSANIKKTASTTLSDTADICYTGDSFIINCGNA